MVDGINNSSSTYNSSTTSGSSVLGKDDFMKMLIAQLKYQDPLNPLEGTEFSAQLAQFSSLEQLSNMNDALNNSIDANYLLSQSVNNTMVATLIGKEVKLSGDTISYSGQDSASLGYNLPSEAHSVTINIYDSRNNLVKTIEGETDSGDHKLSWDFTDNNGNKLSEGTYTFEVEAKASNGNEITAGIYKWGTINSVKYTDSGTKLVIGKTEYDLSDILEISDSDNSGGE